MARHYVTPRQICRPGVGSEVSKRCENPRLRGYGLGMLTPRTRATVMPAALLALAALASCSSGSSKAASVQTTPTPSSSSPAPSVTAPADTVAATAQIKANWRTFFNYTTPRARAAALLQDGSTMTAALAAAVKEQQQTHIKQGAEVTTVTFTSPTTAQVTYKLLNGTAVLLPSASGQAVLVNGVWQVSKSTFCTLVQLGNGGGAVPGC